MLAPDLHFGEILAVFQHFPESQIRVKMQAICKIPTMIAPKQVMKNDVSGVIATMVRKYTYFSHFTSSQSRPHFLGSA
ncbi:MAG: hypothetical protein AAGE37_01570 [Pseudomonadota bacterium]